MPDYPADSILAVDFGTAVTRASLFDVVEGTYRFVASGEAPSTVEPPYLDATEGMRQALLQLQTVTGRVTLDDSAHLIMPAHEDGSGVDVFVATASAGPAVRALLVGLLPDVSLASARKAAASSYIAVVETLGLADRRRDEQMLDSVLGAKADLIFIAGGTDNGASDAVMKLTETVALACHLMPPNSKVKFLFAGNPALREKVDALLGGMGVVRTAPNVRPELGEEVLAPARAALAEILEQIRAAQIGGFADLAQSAGGHILPTAQAEGQLLRFLSRTLNLKKGVLGVDVGSASTVVAAAVRDDLFLHVRPDLGLGVNVAAILDETPLEHITRWLPLEVSENTVREFVLNKAAHPHTIPAEVQDLYLEHAVARNVIRAAVKQARVNWPSAARGPRADLLAGFEQIVGIGAVLGRGPRPGAAALLLLDALQPVGLTTLRLDPHHLAAALGAMAYRNPLAVAQLVETGSILNLATAVSVVGRARPGDVVCKAKLVYENGADMTAEVRFGSLEILPLPSGQTGKLTLKPRLGFDVGFGAGRGKSLAVNGSAVGVLIDARGRPIVFPAAPERRFEAVQQWILKAGGA